MESQSASATASSSSIPSKLDEKKSISQMSLSDPNPRGSKTANKPIKHPRRAGNRGVALSLKEVRNVAQRLNRNQNGSSKRKDPPKVEEHGSSVESVPKSARAKAKAHVELPEKYEMLMVFFKCLLNSIRLLRIKRARCTFTNIGPKIETLTDRRFSYGHLAQLKYILPEAIVIEKILICDEMTLCMKPDLQITLRLDAYENSGNHKMENGYSVLTKLFYSRLVDFFKSHAECEEIPEENLPEPFNQRRLSVPSSTADFPRETLTKTLDQTKPSLFFSPDKISESLQSPFQRISHMPQSFQRRFSQKVVPESERLELHPSTSPLRPRVLTQQPPNVSVVQSPIKCLSKPPISKRSLTYGTSQLKLAPASPLANHEEEIKCKKGEEHTPKEMGGIQRTPLKSVLTPSRMITVMPELQTPKRCCLSPDDDDSASQSKSMSCPTRVRSLKFNTPVKSANSAAEENESEISSSDASIIKFLPEALLQSVRERERNAMEDRDAGVIEAKRRRQMIVCLPKLFDMIHLIFQSTKRSVMKKQELLDKIIANHRDVVDKEEVEEQLKLLQEHAPNWISGKMSSSGDFLFCVSKTVSPESIRARLVEAE